MKVDDCRLAFVKVPVSGAGLRATGFWMENQMGSCNSPDSQLLMAAARSVNHQSNEIKLLAGNVCHHLALAGGSERDIGFLKVHDRRIWQIRPI